jgi:hypothetical protein
MKNHRSIRAGFLLALSLGFMPAVSFAQYFEEEPNDACLASQTIGALDSLPASVAGSLDADFGVDPPIFDVDFYTAEAAAGSRLRLELRGAESGEGTLGDPFLGVFDAACNLIAFNDDSVLGLDSRLDFQVPADGVFTVAAAGCCDAGFDGQHPQEGSYVLHVLEAPPAIGSIGGRLVDAVSGAPLAGFLPPYPFLELFRCGAASCPEYVAFAVPDNDGRFRIETDNNGNPLEVGEYRLEARAEAYEPAQVGPFAIAAAEDFDLGDIGLHPPPVVFGNVVPCADVPASGGLCRYSVEVRNNTRRPIQGIGWSIVQAAGTGSALGYSVFAADREQLARIPALSSRRLVFSFRVPEGVAVGAFFCPDAWFSDRENAFLGTLRTEFLFCVSKQDGAYTAMNEKLAAARLDQRSRPGGRIVKPRN